MIIKLDLCNKAGARYREIRVEVEPIVEDNGIGAYECHGMKGYDSQPFVTWTEVVHSVEMDDYAVANKLHEFDFDKLSERNQAWIVEEITSKLEDYDYREIKRMNEEDYI